MSNKETYAEYTEAFPQMMQNFRANPPRVEGCEDSVNFLLENEIRVIEKARHFAGRGNYSMASEILSASCELIANCTPDGKHRAWANLFYIQQLIAWRGRLKKKHWRKLAKARVEYLSQALAIVGDSNLDWPVLSELRQWQPTTERMLQEAKSYRDYSCAADFAARLGFALDRVILGEGVYSKTLLDMAIASLPVADDDA
jgi:hypothetical protein|nr:MAG TPA: hypothetical protein [Caudoviricetes sp.]